MLWPCKLFMPNSYTLETDFKSLSPSEQGMYKRSTSLLTWKFPVMVKTFTDSDVNTFNLSLQPSHGPLQDLDRRCKDQSRKFVIADWFMVWWQLGWPYFYHARNIFPNYYPFGEGFIVSSRFVSKHLSLQGWAGVDKDKRWYSGFQCFNYFPTFDNHKYAFVRIEFHVLAKGCC